MTLRRTGPRLTGVRLSLRDQLLLQQIVTGGVTRKAERFGLATVVNNEWALNDQAHRAALILQRHSVEVTLDEHTGRITFNPEVVNA